MRLTGEAQLRARWLSFVVEYLEELCREAEIGGFEVGLYPDEGEPGIWILEVDFPGLHVHHGLVVDMPLVPDASFLGGHALGTVGRVWARVKAQAGRPGTGGVSGG